LTGGFDLGFERAGLECAWQCEIDDKASAVLAKHWPEVRRYKDVRTIGKHNLEPVDVICGGFPCQDVSIAGKRKGLDGERSGLWFEFARIIDELEPGWVVIENVPGLLSSNRGRDFAVILRWLVERGYGVCWRILDAQYFGVAQRRRRVFIVASFGNGNCAKVLFESEGVRWNPPSRSKAGEGIASTFTVRSGKDGGGKGYLGQASLAMTLGGQEQYLDIAGTLDGKSCASNRGSQANETDFLAYRMTAFGEYADDVPSSAMKQRDFKDATDLVIAHETGKGFWTEGLPGLRGQPGGMPENIVYNSGVRRLTPTECERLQGFPDGWTNGQSDSVRYKQLGNAVSVPPAKWIGIKTIGAS
jgi:DNA (cytosine-5)-methyltransferase 1